MKVHSTITIQQSCLANLTQKGTGKLMWMAYSQEMAAHNSLIIPPVILLEPEIHVAFLSQISAPNPAAFQPNKRVSRGTRSGFCNVLCIVNNKDTLTVSEGANMSSLNSLQSNERVVQLAYLKQSKNGGC